MEIKKTNGFTLIELIIVIVIIGILAAITVIGYLSQADKARHASVKSAMAEAINGANVCITDGVGTVSAPTANVGGNNICSVATSVTGKWPNVQAIGAASWTMTSVAPTTAAGPVVSDGTNSITCTLSGCTTTAGSW